MIREFLQIPFDRELTDLAVKKCDTDKFKALCNFLKKDLKTHERNLELLAWLIDFPYRPYSTYCRITNGKSDALSELTITKSGIVEENILENIYHRQDALTAKNGKIGAGYGGQDYLVETDDTRLDDYNLIPNDPLPKKEVTLEYPSGIKLSVDASDLSLIAQLLKL